MAWIALSCPHGAGFDPDGLCAPTALSKLPRSAQANGLLTKGTLLIEAPFSEGPERTVDLFDADITAPWPLRLCVKIRTDGAVVFGLWIGGEGEEITINRPKGDAPETVRLQYSWDAPARRAVLSLFDPSTGHLFYKELENPKPWAMAHVRTLALTPAGSLSRALASAGGGAAFSGGLAMANGARYLAVSDSLEPFGPMPGLAGNPLVDTPKGYLPLAEIEEGDSVRDMLSGEAVTVVSAIKSTLPALGTLRPIRLRNPVTGGSHMVASAQTNLRRSGPLIDYLFGCEAVLAPISMNVKLNAPYAPAAPALIAYRQVICERPCILSTPYGGISSLFFDGTPPAPAGEMGESLASLLFAQLAGRPQPQDTSAALPILRPYESLTLRNMLAA